MSIQEGTILRVVANHVEADGSIQQNVFNCVLTSAGGSDDEEDVASDMEDWVTEMFNNLTAFLRVEWDPGEVVTYEYDSGDDDWDEVGSEVGSWVTSGAGDPLPRGVAAVIQGNTMDPDIRGRKYIGMMDENNHTDEVWVSGLLTALAAFAADWVTGFVGSATGATFTTGVWSPTKTTFVAFGTSVIINAIAGYQRRRKQGVGI